MMNMNKWNQKKSGVLASAMGTALAMVALISSGCSTMYFQNVSGEPTRTELTEWHHDGILRLVEFSSPVDLQSRCEGKKWKTVKVEKDFVQGLVTSVAYGWYDPWGVSISCR